MTPLSSLAAILRRAASLEIVVLAFAFLFALATGVEGQEAYDRPVSSAPQPDDIGAGYQTPEVQRTSPRSAALQMLDVVLLIGGMAAIAWVSRRGRRRWVVTAVTLASLAYFGFYRQGCVCPIGATQNVAASLSDASLATPMVVLAFFLLPLAASLLAGRVFCGGVCPLGAIQDLVLLRPVQTPQGVDRWLGMFRYVYLGLAVWFAVLPAGQRDFVICRFDPFVGFFRLNGPAWMLGVGVALLLLGTVVGRPYCRYLCPYGGLISVVSRFAIWPVRITPDEELDCGLCVDSCPFGAIKDLRAKPSECLACARCFAHCPRQQLAWGEIELVELDELVSSAKCVAQRSGGNE
ncbi:putative electron transport protein YccM [Posidoniimonas polymericola]|uniref:Putative electron transport protein YccM n=1 Tax=Posidoniimonas polymericola TaxID=2528002 RepID=A0A5C5YMF9_9BACT|nr:4Fe-4S binding protein [Posidoniimonas polymericola]TWT76161.1 putative electron transport protein YccM [Posidoniimonas polymericola]